MKKRSFLYIISPLLWLLSGVLPAGLLPAEPLISYGAYDQVASENEQAAHEQVGTEGMVPVWGRDVEDGVYAVNVESSSPMFRVEKAELTVRDGEMSAVLTLGGKGYLALFMGTAREAAAGNPSDYIKYVEDEEGKYTYTVPVEALDMAVDCAAYSRNKEKWYGRSILFRAESLPAGAVSVELPDYEELRRTARRKRIEAMALENLDMEDGVYKASLDLSGGSGRAFVESPAVLLVREGKAYVHLRWSSPDYDYMKLGSEKYMPINKEGNSEFEIPVTVFDEPITVIGDTLAMGTPHEIEYTLIIHGDSVVPEEPESGRREQPDSGMNICLFGGAFLLVAGGFLWFRRKGKSKG